MNKGWFNENIHKYAINLSRSRHKYGRDDENRLGNFYLETFNITDKTNMMYLTIIAVPKDEPSDWEHIDSNGQYDDTPYMFNGIRISRDKRGFEYLYCDTISDCGRIKSVDISQFLNAFPEMSRMECVTIYSSGIYYKGIYSEPQMCHATTMAFLDTTEYYQT